MLYYLFHEAIKKINFQEVNENVITITNAIMRGSPTTELDNKIMAINSNTMVIRTGISETWSRVTYQNKTGYILNSELKIYEEPKEEIKPEIEPENKEES